MHFPLQKDKAKMNQNLSFNEALFTSVSASFIYVQLLLTLSIRNYPLANFSRLKGEP